MLYRTCTGDATRTRLHTDLEEREDADMKIGVGIGDIAGAPADLNGLIAQAKRAEAEGFASGWFANIFGMDAIMAAALCGRETTRIELGTAVVPTFPRHPVAIAQQALSAQAAAGGRFTLGIGLSHQVVIEAMLGLSFAKPFSHMKEYLAVLGPLIRTGNVSYQGNEYRVAASVGVPGASPCPILVAALAPKMLALTGAEADGTVTWMTGPKTLREHTVPRISEAAAKAGRPAPRVVASLPIAVTKESAAAREGAAAQFQIYGALPSYRAMLDREGVEGPADVAIVGDESDVGAQLDRLAEIGTTDFLAIPFRVRGDGDAVERTRALLIDRARCS
jgi:F420-dependent oxidoreductase-like protein